MTATHSRALLPLLFTGVLMGALDLAIIGPALPAIQAEFGMNDRQLSMLFNAYVLFQMIGTPVLAKVGDRVGLRLAYVVSIGFFVAGSLLLVVAREPALLYVGRALQGFGGGGIFPVAAAVIGNALPSRERGPALGILGAVFGIAFILGPVMGGLLLPFGWHWLFLVNVPIGAVLVAGAWRLLPTAGRPTHQPLDLAGVATLSLMLIALVYGLSSLDTRAVGASLSSLPTAGALLLVLVLLPLFWQVEKRAADPIVRPGLLRVRPVAVASVISAGVGAIQAAGTFYPAFAVASMGVSQSLASWLLLPGVVVATIASPVIGRLVNVISLRSIIAGGMLLVALSVLTYGMTTPMTITVFIVASLVGNAGMGGVHGAPLRLVMLDNCQPDERGAAQGLLSNFTSAGRLLGAAFVGAIASSTGGGTPGYQAAFLVMAGLGMALALLGLTLTQSTAIGQPGGETVQQDLS